MTLTADDLAILLGNFQSSDWTELTLSLDGLMVSLAKGPRAATAAGPPAPAAAPTPAPRPPQPHEVRAASVGVFRRSADVGERVEDGAVLAVLEVFRRRDEVRAERAGVVATIYVEDGDMVEYGQPLFSITPDSG
jgi:acetyl-CoA carboxylase biotin carboxyl carrier protein